MGIQKIVTMATASSPFGYCLLPNAYSAACRPAALISSAAARMAFTILW